MEQELRLAQFDAERIYKEGVEPAITAGVIVMIVAGLGVASAIGIIRLRPWAYWVGLLYNLLFWLYYVYSLIRLAMILPILEQMLVGLIGMSAGRGGAASMATASRIIAAIKGFSIFTVLYFSVIMILLGFAWRLFTSGSARFVALDPPSGDPSEHFNRGIAYRRRGMWYQSMVEWERAVALSPSDPTYRHALGLVYAQLKRTPEAQRELAEAMSLDPNNMAIMQDAQKLGVSS
jgi:tetratricopeptide (TPR) repeat protein